MKIKLLLAILCMAAVAQIGSTGGSSGGSSGGSRGGSSGGSSAGSSGGSSGGSRGGSNGGSNGGSRGVPNGGSRGVPNGGSRGGSNVGSRGDTYVRSSGESYGGFYGSYGSESSSYTEPPTLKCFSCSALNGSACPSASDQKKIWAQSVGKFVKYGSAITSCMVGYSSVSKIIYYQSGVQSLYSCQTENADRIKTTINGVDVGAAVKCCTANGCNWNSDDALNNVFFDLSEGLSVTIIVTIVVSVLVACLFIGRMFYGFCCNIKNKPKNSKIHPRTITVAPKQMY